MISHTYKCIFIHIPRCGGTSVETWLCGHDGWEIEPETKHLIGSQARELYSQWWDEYFKFAIVRDPSTRTQSMLHYGAHSGLSKGVGEPIDFSGYGSLFGTDVVLEHDHRFASRDELIRTRHRPGRVYRNILDEKLDFVSKFETLASDMVFVQRRLGCPRPFNVHVERSAGVRQPLLDQDLAWIEATYRDDFAEYGYASPSAATEHQDAWWPMRANARS